MAASKTKKSKEPLAAAKGIELVARMQSAFNDDRRIRQAVALLREAKAAADLIEDSGIDFIKRSLWLDFRDMNCFLEVVLAVFPVSRRLSGASVAESQEGELPLVFWGWVCVERAVEILSNVVWSDDEEDWTYRSRAINGLATALRWQASLIEGQIEGTLFRHEQPSSPAQEQLHTLLALVP